MNHTLASLSRLFVTDAKCFNYSDIDKTKNIAQFLKGYFVVYFIRPRRLKSQKFKGNTASVIQRNIEQNGR